MTPEEKIEFVRNKILDKAKISPSGIFYIDICSITVIDPTENSGIPDDAPITLSYQDQWSIIRKLEEDGFIKNIELDAIERIAWLELSYEEEEIPNLDFTLDDEEETRNENKVEKDMEPKKIETDKKYQSNIAQIKSITIVNENKKNKKRIVINKNYIDSFEIIESTSINIRSLAEAIIDKTDVLREITHLDSCKSYLNSNRNCRIYKNKLGKQIYAITPIVIFNNSYASDRQLEILSSIKTDNITFSKYSKQLSQQKNRNKT